MGGAPGIVTDVLNSPGQPLDTATRSYMESRFGQDFGDVRVHTDSTAARSAAAIDAHAYTVGCDIVFGAGQYAPGTSQGGKLLAHELTHTVQQTAGGIQRCGDHTSPGCICAEEKRDALIQRDFFDDAAEAATGLAQGIADTASDTASAVGDAASAAAGAVSDAASAAADAVSDAASAAAGAVSDAASAAAGAVEETVDWLATTAGQAALDGANALAGLFGGAVVIRGGCLIITIPEIPLFPSFQKTLGETPEYGFFIPIMAGATMVGPIPLAGTFGILGYAQGSIEGAVGPGAIRGIRVEICPFSGRVLATGQLYAAAAIAPRLTLFGGLTAAAGTTLPLASIPVIVILQAGLRGTGTGWFIGAVQDTVTLAYSAGTLSFDNVTDLMGGVLLQGDVDFFAALRLYTKIICQYVYPLGHWETGAAWKLTIPIHAGLSESGGTGGVGPIRFGPMPIQDIVTAIHPLATGFNCMSWEEIKQFLCDNGMLPPQFCATEGQDRGRESGPPFGPVPFGPSGGGGPVPPSPVPSTAKVPSGRTKSDAIPVDWFKPLFLYPDPIVLNASTGGTHEYEMQVPDQFVEPGHSIGVQPAWIPKRGKKMRLEKVLQDDDRGPAVNRFRSLLQRHGYSMKGEDADHVQDLGWGGPDGPDNLWPLNSNDNQAAGRAFQNFRITYAVNPGEPARPETTNVRLGDAAVAPGPENVIGRFFVIRNFQRP
ncbi:hypothetical protein A5724_19220 [Mycobacterium sp. ACS1612]|nr:hypothetical protein A5724_19220 [Mycobacterium sp. ACS1612]